MLSYLILRFVVGLMCLTTALTATQMPSLSLRNNLALGRPGDYIVAAQNKAYTVLHIYSKSEDNLTVEEITVPSTRIPKNNFSWKDWVRKGAPYHTCWMMYTVRLSTGDIRESYSFSQGSWYPASLADTFLPTLLNLHFTLISDKERKKIGHPLKDGGDGGKRIWQPPMVIDGQQIPNVQFHAWRARWPKDSTPLSEKVIEVYLPKESDKYASYFPYWLQAAGVIGKADLRVIDSGAGLVSPVPPLPGRKGQ